MRALQEIGAALTDKQSRADERALLTALPEAFSLLEALSGEDRTRVRSVVVTLTRGMETDLTTFPPEDSGRVAAFRDLEELDSYTYYVAGCVGEFWTTITMAHTPALREWDAGRMSETGVRFGKALQLTNVLRDVPRDLRIGRCYLPETELARVGLTPEALLNPSSGDKARPVLVAGIEVALEHYRAAEEYLLSIPGRCLRLRLAVLWPLLIGLATLSRLAYNEAWLDPGQTVKSQSWVGLSHDGSLAALRVFRPASACMDSTPSEAGRDSPLRRRFQTAFPFGGDLRITSGHRREIGDLLPPLITPLSFRGAERRGI